MKMACRQPCHAPKVPQPFLVKFYAVTRAARNRHVVAAVSGHTDVVLLALFHDLRLPALIALRSLFSSVLRPLQHLW
jgi:hypothetical protein